ncbi:MAG: 16S rRNA processing protein RimM [Myxococcales bacterium]|nr:MAG: 16S rRNA processing protein RimM [Myxococcales bacterium]
MSSRAQDLELVALGRVARAHGIVGELRIHLYNPDSAVLREQKEIILLHNGQRSTLRIHKAREVPKALLLSIDGIRTRTQAEAWQGAEVCVPSDALPALDDQEYYIKDLVGMQVYDADEQALGQVIDVLSYPSVDCLVVNSADGRREVPMIDDFVLHVDTSKGLVIVQRWDEFEIQPD